MSTVSPPFLFPLIISEMKTLGSSYALYSNGDADIDHDNLITRMNANFTNVEEVVYTFFSKGNFTAADPSTKYDRRQTLISKPQIFFILGSDTTF